MYTYMYMCTYIVDSDVIALLSHKDDESIVGMYMYMYMYTHIVCSDVIALLSHKGDESIVLNAIGCLDLVCRDACNICMHV